MNHTENYKKYAYRSLLIMMLGVVFFILFGSRLISQNVYASYDPSKTYIDADILKFEKVWLDDQEEDRPENITFTITLSEGENKPNEDVEVTLTKSDNWKKEYIIKDKYAGYWPGTIKEIMVDGYEYMGEYESDTSIDGSSNRVVTITLTNKKLPTGNLTVSKDVNGNKGDTNKDFHFTVTLSDTSINGTYGDMTFKDGIATFTLKDNESITATSLPTGITYKVIEQEANQDGYITTSTGTTGEIQKNATSKAEFINTKNEYGSLTVSKDVNGNKGDINKDFHFTVTLSDTSINGTYGDMTFKDGIATFTLKDNESITATSLPTGITYKVIEQEANQDGYITTSTGTTGEIQKNATSKAEFINTKNEYGSLTVSKDVNGNKGDTNKDFHFTVKLSDSSINGTYGDMTFKDGVATFTLKDNESLTATSLPTGVTYKVIEQEANQDGYITTSTGTTGEIQKNVTSKAEFINTKNEYGSLTVSKDVNGNKGDTNKDFHFTVKLSDSSINGTYGDMTFKDGIATFTLKDNESLTATSLPTGISYKVIEQEANQDGYITTSINEEGYILNNQNIKVDFVNTKEVESQSSNQTPPENNHQSQPQTGDDSALMVYMSLGLMSGLSALGLILLKKKA